MRFHRAVTGLLLASALISSGCLSLMGGETKAGATAARQVEAEMGLVHDPALVAYVREIGQRLAAHASRKNVPWKFQIVDMPEPNAFALPGGYVYVSRGLLALVNDESELAGVIGHEIGHVTAHHGNKRVTLAAPFMILSGVTGWVTGIVSPRLGETLSNAGNTMAQGLLIAPFSRSQEREADRIGAELSAKAGWDPGSFGTFLETLGRFEAALTGEERHTSWLDSHPASADRAAATRKFAAGLERATPNPVARDRADLFRRLDGLLLGPDPAAGVRVDDRFVHPELDWSIRFPEGWTLLNSPAAVVSREADGNAAIILQLAASDKSLDALLKEIEEQASSKHEIERKTLNGRATAHTVLEQKGDWIDVTWIEHKGHVYQIIGICRRKQQATWQVPFDRSIASFREMQPAELKKIRDQRLRIATAKAKESLDELLTRLGSDWDAALTGVANSIEIDAPLDRGQLVKFGKQEPYAPRR